uniref:gibberellin 2-beta-dioxygenase 3 n=1 Tax=Erigeron canadensis TaxID=72917 RepID=UPI001CB8DF39|nr:gibberellin 2-beta-dioxygenase 3 [Erigeron canadensis]
MASSTHNRENIFHTVTSAPPPTPSTTTITTSDSNSIDLLSRLLHRLPPNLANTPTLLRRRSSLSTPTTTSPLLIPYTNLDTSLPSAFKLGFFQLIDHPIPSKLAHLAKIDSQAILNISQHQKQQHFPRNWPLGFENDIEDDNKSLFLDSSCSTNGSLDFSINSLREFTKEMEKVGLYVMEAITCALRLHNPTLDDPSNVCSLMWVSDGSGQPVEKMIGSGQIYPYVIGLHYQFASEKCSLLSDSGWVSVQSQKDSILVTLGDIAQVWSNGKLKKIRGNPTLNIEEEAKDKTTLSMSLLVTLPLENTVSTLPSRAVSNDGDTDHHNDKHDQDEFDKSKEEVLFDSFSFEDYAWRVYHERVPLKDPLDRYRTSKNL